MDNCFILIMIFAPLVGVIINLFFRKYLSSANKGKISSFFCGISLLSSLYGIYALTKIPSAEKSINFKLFDWIITQNFDIDISFLLDPVSLTLICVTLLSGLVINLYSVEYMKDESDSARYFCCLGMIIFFSQILVLAGNMIFFLSASICVSVFLYSLVGFWYFDEKKSHIAKRVFFVNIFADITLLGAIICLLFVANAQGLYSLNTETIRALATLVAPDNGNSLITLSCFLILIYSAVKSSQFPFNTLLQKTIAAPTPVAGYLFSALVMPIGVYTLIRMSPVLLRVPALMNTLVGIGAITALISALTAFTQVNIKKILACAAVSQTGLMFFAIGIGCFNGALYCLAANSAYICLLFLCVSNVVYALGGESNILKYGFIFKKMPIMCVMFTIGSLAFLGFSPGIYFHPQSIVLNNLFQTNKPLYLCFLLTVIITACYMVKTYVLIFFKRIIGKEANTACFNMPGKYMEWPIYLMAFVSLILGFFIRSGVFSVVDEAAPTVVSSHWGNTIAMMASLITVYFALKFALSGSFLHSKHFFPRVRLLVSNSFYLDDLYSFAIIKPCKIILRDIIFVRLIENALLSEIFIKGLKRAADLCKLYFIKLHDANTGLFFFLSLAFVTILIFIL